MTHPHALLVAGPTASGKSALALALAEHLHGTIINADSMQIYRELRVLTARPTPRRGSPRPAFALRRSPCRAARQRRLVARRGSGGNASGPRQDNAPILTGGTGLYFAALTDGLADIPDPGPQARAEARRLLPGTRRPGAARRPRRTSIPPPPPGSSPTTASASPAPGRYGAAPAWASPPGRAQCAQPAPWRFTAILLDPPREDLRAAIATRFAAMLAQGAFEEVRALLELGLDPALPAMRAHGVPELVRLSTQRNYPGTRRPPHRTGHRAIHQRQATWFRHHALAAPSMDIIHRDSATRRNFQKEYR